MTEFNMHAASAPMFVVLLNNLNTWLDKAEALAAEKKFDIENLLASRLAPDMLPLRGQIQLSTAFAKNTMCRLAGQTPPDYPDTDVTLAQLRARIARTLDIVQSISAVDLKDAATRPITFGMGPDIKLTLPGADYLVKFALPNFYFHTVTAYDILRHNGLELGKKDFMIGAFDIPGM
jgi:uncharacterized protein